MNGLRVPWAQYTLPFSLPLLSMGAMGSRPVVSPTYTRLTMANYENFNLTGALGNAPQKINPPDYPGFDKDTPLTTALKTPLTTHLSTPSSHPPPLLHICQTPTPNPTSTTVSFSSITTFESYIYPQKVKPFTNSILASSFSVTLTVPSSSHARPRPSTTTNHLPLSILFGPRQWNKYFHIHAHAPYSKNTFQFQKWIQRQMGKVTFHTWPDKSCIVIVNSESKVEAMLTLKDLDWKPFPVSHDAQLYTHTGIVLIPNEICSDGVSWCDCSTDLFELIADKHDIAHVSCFTINPCGHRKHPVNIAIIAFK